MRLRNLVLAAAAAMFMAVPARADLVLLFLDSPTQVINDSVAFGANPYSYVDPNTFNTVNLPAVPALNNPFAPVGPGQAGSINMVAGTTRVIQVALFDTVLGTNNPSFNGSSIPATGPYTQPRWLVNGPGSNTSISQQFGLTQYFTRITSTIVGPASAPTGGAFIAPPAPTPGPPYLPGETDAGNDQINLVTLNGGAFINAGSNPPAVTDYGKLIPLGFGDIPNWVYNDGNAQFPNGAGLGGRLALFNFRITVPASDLGGTYPITISDRDPTGNDWITLVRGPGSGNIGMAGDTIALDSTIFSALHPNYTLNVNVTPVPEPTSIALVGMALAGLGYRKLRRKKEVVA